MPEEFKHDVFLSHSSKDKAVARPVAERLRADGLRVWFDEWKSRRATAFRRRSRKLEHCACSCSACRRMRSVRLGAVGGGHFRFRDPLNKERRFTPAAQRHAHQRVPEQFLYSIGAQSTTSRSMGSSRSLPTACEVNDV
jgi:hypothetical protein